MLSERRRHPRYNQELSALLVLPDGHRMEANTVDLSSGGARIITNKRLPAGVHILMELTPPSNKSSLKLWANTLHSKKLDDQIGYGLGLEFKNIPSHYKGLILSLSPSSRLN